MTNNDLQASIETLNEECAEVQEASKLQMEELKHNIFIKKMINKRDTEIKDT